MCSKSVRVSSTVCTWCGNNQSEKADWCLVSHWVQLGNGKAVGDEGWWWCLCLFCVCWWKMWFMKLEVPDSLAPDSYGISLTCCWTIWCGALLVFLHRCCSAFCFVWLGKSAFALLCVCDRERMLREVSHGIRCCCSNPPKFFWGSGTSLSVLEELSGSPNTCSKEHTLDNLVEFSALAMCYHRSEEPCPCCCHQHRICFCLEQLNFIGLSVATCSDTAMLWNL